MLGALRYGLPLAFIVAGFAVLIIRRDTTGLEGWAMLVGAGISVLMFNVLFRIGASGDKERRAEDEAREFFSTHGHWPDEEPKAPRASSR
jgi:hypothetical protein